MPEYCDDCGHETRAADLTVVLVCERTHSSPAEYEQRCPDCRGMSAEEYESRRDDALERQMDEARGC